MNPNNPLRHFVAAFLIAVLGYYVVYHAIEHRRTRKGPWVVTFRQGTDGPPSLVINQPTLRITNVQISFAENKLLITNSSSTFFFSQPRPVPYEVPFGKCLFMDTTFLPGTVTFQLFGHEIELLPRVLIIDHQEHPWRSGNTTLTNLDAR